VLALAAAVVAMVSAMFPLPVPGWLGVLGVLALVLVPRRSFALLVLAGVVMCMSHHAWVQLDRPLPERVKGEVTDLTDPKRVIGHRMAFEGTHGGRHFALYVRDDLGGLAAKLRAGDEVSVIGDVRPLAGASVASQRRRHIAGAVSVRTLRRVGGGRPWDQLANGLRADIERGASSLSPLDRSLLTGLVYGDDRDEPEDVVEQFRAAGLSHLLAVSGQNVAFVLAVLAPVVRPAPLAVRCVAGCAVLLLFGVVTRWEPSLLRAEVMAMLIMWGRWSGRVLDPPAVLAAAVVVSLLLDPFLVGSVGFLLSVSACAGIVLLAGPLMAVLPGPTGVRRALSCTIAAQLGVAPVQLAVFHDMALVGVVTNLLVEPAAAFVMAWGLVGGLLAGVLGGMPAALVHMPTQWSIAWVRACARVGSGLAALPWSSTVAVVVMVAGALAAMSRHRRSSYYRRGGEPVDDASGVPPQGER
jgi:competence protein ComEC